MVEEKEKRSGVVEEFKGFLFLGGGLREVMDKVGEVFVMRGVEEG